MLRSTNNRRLFFGIENLENRRMLAADVMAEMPGDAAPDTYFVADSFSFGVEREMKESGEKGGTADINIGVGELQECTISKSTDNASSKLSQAAISGNSCGTSEIAFVEVGGDSSKYEYELDRCFVKSWSTSGDADDRPTEEVAFYYNKIAFEYAHAEDGVADRGGMDGTTSRISPKTVDGA